MGCVKAVLIVLALAVSVSAAPPKGATPKAAPPKLAPDPAVEAARSRMSALAQVHNWRLCECIRKAEPGCVKCGGTGIDLESVRLPRATPEELKELGRVTANTGGETARRFAAFLIIARATGVYPWNLHHSLPSAPDRTDWGEPSPYEVLLVKSGYLGRVWKPVGLAECRRVGIPDAYIGEWFEDCIVFGSGASMLPELLKHATGQGDMGLAWFGKQYRRSAVLARKIKENTDESAEERGAKALGQ